MRPISWSFVSRDFRLSSLSERVRLLTRLLVREIKIKHMTKERKNSSSKGDDQDTFVKNREISESGHTPTHVSCVKDAERKGLRLLFRAEIACIFIKMISTFSVKISHTQPLLLLSLSSSHPAIYWTKCTQKSIKEKHQREKESKEKKNQFILRPKFCVYSKSFPHPALTSVYWGVRGGEWQHYQMWE